MKAKSAGVFAVGLSVGALAAANWRTVVKKTVRVGLDLKTAGARSAEDLTDLIREAQAEASMGMVSSKAADNGAGATQWTEPM